MLKREKLRPPFFTTVVNWVTKCVVASDSVGLLVGGIALRSWIRSGAPTAAGVTVPYSRTSPVCPPERTWSATRTAARTVTIELYTGRESSVITRKSVLLERLATRKEKRPAALVR